MSIYSNKHQIKNTPPPTPEQRLEIYTKAREYVMKNRKHRCICLGIKEAQQNLGFVNENGSALWETIETYCYDGGNNMAANFPELFKRKPRGKSHSKSWWMQPNNFPSKRRVTAINGMIAEVLQSSKTIEF
jgi:hypothetical protein